MSKLTALIASADAPRLARKTGLHQARLERLALGEEPTLGELRRIASALHVSLEDLAGSGTNSSGAQVLFRNASAGTDIAQRLSRKIGHSLDILSHPQATDWVQAFTTRGTSFQDAEDAAVLFRRMFYRDDQVSPLFDLPSVLANSLNVILFAINAREIDGASAYFGGSSFIFVSARFLPRMLFTVAHELGHLLAHREHLSDFAVVDAETDDWGGTSRTTDERFAHTFASCLLMPKGGVGIALKKIREHGRIVTGDLGDIEVLYLSRIFGVSFEAAARRCEDLSLIPKGGGASLNEELRKRYGSAEKRADELGLPPRPELRFPKVPKHLLQSAVARIRSGELSVGKAASILEMSVADLIAANVPTTH